MRGGWTGWSIWQEFFVIFSLLGLLIVVMMFCRLISTFNIQVLQLPVYQFISASNLEIPEETVLIYIPKGFFSKDDLKYLKVSAWSCVDGCVCSLKFRDVVNETSYVISISQWEITYSVDLSNFNSITFPEEVKKEFIGGNYFILYSSSAKKEEIGKLLNLNDAIYCVKPKKNVLILAGSSAKNYIVIIGNPNDHYINIPVHYLYEDKDNMVIKFEV